MSENGVEKAPRGGMEQPHGESGGYGGLGGSYRLEPEAFPDFIEALRDVSDDMMLMCVFGETHASGSNPDPFCGSAEPVGNPYRTAAATMFDLMKQASVQLSQAAEALKQTRDRYVDADLAQAGKLGSVYPND